MASAELTFHGYTLHVLYQRLELESVALGTLGIEACFVNTVPDGGHAHVERGTFGEFLRAESSCPLAILLPQSLSSRDDGHMSLHLAESSFP